MAEQFSNVKQRKANMVEVAGKAFDCGFIPSGVEIPLLDEFNAQIYKQSTYSLPENFDQLSDDEKMKAQATSAVKYANENRAQTRADNIKFVSIFTSFFDPDYTEEYISKNASGPEVNTAWQALEATIVEDYFDTVKNLNGGTGGKKAKASARKKK